MVSKVSSSPNQSGIPCISPFSKPSLDVHLDFSRKRQSKGARGVSFALDVDLPPPRNFPSPSQGHPSFLIHGSMAPGSLWIPFFPSFWEREESQSTLLRFSAVLIQNVWKSWEKSPWINMPRDKHPSQSTATSGGERGNFPWTSFGISGLSNISNASIKCSNAKFLARFPDARQGTERN